MTRRADNLPTRVRSGCGLFARRRRLRRVPVEERDGMVFAVSRAAA
jgi:hypothetical protein